MWAPTAASFPPSQRASHAPRPQMAKLQMAGAVLEAQQQIEEERLMRTTLEEEGASLDALLDYQRDLAEALHQGPAAMPALRIRWSDHGCDHDHYQPHAPQLAAASSMSVGLKALQLPDVEQPQQQQQQQQPDDSHQTGPPKPGASALSTPDTNDVKALVHVFCGLVGWSEPEVRSLEITLPTFRCNAVDVAPWQLRWVGCMGQCWVGPRGGD